MTIRESISNVKTILKKINADNRLTNKQIYSILKKHSEWLVERTSASYKLGRRDIIFQTYSCADVIDVPAVDDCCNITTKCRIKRTRDKIPEMFEDAYGLLIKEITSVDGSTNIKFSNITEFKGKKDNPWGPKTNKYYFYNNGYIYGDLPKKIRIVGLFKEDISKLNKCDSCGDTTETCKAFMDTEWSVPALIQAQIIDATIKEFAPTLQIPAQEMIDKNENQP